MVTESDFDSYAKSLKKDISKGKMKKSLGGAIVGKATSFAFNNINVIGPLIFLAIIFAVIGIVSTVIFAIYHIWIFLIIIASLILLLLTLRIINKIKKKKNARK